MLAAAGLSLVLEDWIWLLGFVPLSLGLRKLVLAIHAHNGGDQMSPAAARVCPG
jgi:cadmium resistance protein CadD (predicted permease)